MQYYKWLESKVDVFWGEIAPCEHVVQIYENDTIFLELLAEYVSDGFQKNESVVIIATREHLHLLEERLKNFSFDIFTLRLQDRFIAIDAHEALSRFMIGGWPDEILFRHAVQEILSRAGKNGRPVRAFGEMVALLWAQGHNGATIQLEHLWNDCRNRNHLPSIVHIQELVSLIMQANLLCIFAERTPRLSAPRTDHRKISYIKMYLQLVKLNKGKRRAT